MADRLGISPHDASAKIAEFLPLAMSGIAEEGQLQGAGTDLLSQAGGLLRGLKKSLPAVAALLRGDRANWACMRMAIDEA